jgi:putative addiction module component (TIGR02574 family)
MSDLHNEIRSLSAAEKIDLLDAVWESLENDPLPLSTKQREELDYRVARYRENPADVTPWEQVRADLHKGR